MVGKLLWLMTATLMLVGMLVGRAPVHAAEARVALIVGNAAYRGAPLINPVNDASDLASKLEKYGFNVLLREDVSERGLKDAVAEFSKYLKKGGIGLFFFAGHGVQVGGENYLLPVDAGFQSETEIVKKSVSAEHVLSRMAEAGNRTNIVILDACRNNPYQRTRSIGQGLGAMNVGRDERGTFIAYATSPGSTAADGGGRNGTYTRHLLWSLDQPDSDIDKVFGRVRAGVVSETRGEQVPWTTTSLIGSFHFNLEEAARASVGMTLLAPEQPQAEDSPAVAFDPAKEKAHWDRIRESRNPEDYSAYLAQFPAGPNAAFAKYRMQRLLADANVKLASTAPASQPATLPPALPVVVVATTTVASLPTSSHIGETFRDCPECPELVIVPAGKFIMGADPGKPGHQADEGPPHPVSIPGTLAMGKYEVTRAQFATFVKETGHSQKNPGCNTLRGGKIRQRLPHLSWDTPGFPQTPGDPVVCVSWEDAQAYVIWLSAKTRKPYRLPSEAEWEYVARAGVPADALWPGGRESACRFANLADRSVRTEVPGLTTFPCGDGHVFTAPVGSFKPSATGVHDMLGNVWEWVEDCWNKNYTGAPADGAAWITGRCEDRIFRGGAWNSAPHVVRPGYRDREEKSERHDNLGFRVLRPTN